MYKIILFALLTAFSFVSGDTINSTSKNPSMAINGTQRDSATVINPYVIPVAVSGAACNSATDTVAVVADHSSQLICQSGVWVAPSLPAAYDDSFDGSGFTSGANLCSAAALPQRTYDLTLARRSIVLLSLISQRPGGYSTAGTGFNGQLCGYDHYAAAASNSTSSANCSLKLNAGEYVFNFCIADGSSAYGTIVIIPNE